MSSPASDHSEQPQPAYEAIGGDGAAPTIVFWPEGVGPGRASEPVTSHGDPDIDWSGPDGVQAVAQAILQHHTSEEPDQAALEALVMDRGDHWAANASWVLTVAELDAILERT